jgi:hypothetical protein
MATLTNNSNKLEELIEILPEKSLPKTHFNDATATAAQVHKGYTAYAGTSKLTGTAQLPSEAEADAFRKYAPLALQAGSTAVLASSYDSLSEVWMHPTAHFNYKNLGGYTYKLTDDITIKRIVEGKLQLDCNIINEHPDLLVEVFLNVTSTWTNVTDGTLPEPGIGTLPGKPPLTPSSIENYYLRHLLAPGESVTFTLRRDNVGSNLYNRYTWAWQIEGVNWSNETNQQN